MSFNNNLSNPYYTNSYECINNEWSKNLDKDLKNDYMNNKINIINIAIKYRIAIYQIINRLLYLKVINKNYEANGYKEYNNIYKYQEILDIFKINYLNDLKHINLLKDNYKTNKDINNKFIYRNTNVTYNKNQNYDNDFIHDYKYFYYFFNELHLIKESLNGKLSIPIYSIINSNINSNINNSNNNSNILQTSLYISSYIINVLKKANYNIYLLIYGNETLYLDNSYSLYKLSNIFENFINNINTNFIKDTHEELYRHFNIFNYNIINNNNYKIMFTKILE
jgi:hypothetical protein